MDSGKPSWAGACLHHTEIERMMRTARAALLGTLALGLGYMAPAGAQQAPRTGDSPATTAPANDRAARGDMRNDSRSEARTETGTRSAIVEASALESGANSFTEGQARSRMEDAGFTDIQDLRKDEAGFWRGRARHGGSSTDVAMDFRGRIAHGPGVANLAASRASGSSRPDAATSSSATGRGDAPRTAASPPDGTLGNPPSTMTGRAVDRMQGETPRADGTPGNPPGTAVGRAVDRATGADAPATPPVSSGGGQTR